MAHVETLIRVNAWIDVGVAPLVEVLNLFPWVETCDSCQGDEGRPADVIFRSRAGINPLQQLGAEIATLADGRFWFELLIEWRAGYVGPRAVLRTDNVTLLAHELRQLATSSAHSWAYPHGSDGRRGAG